MAVKSTKNTTAASHFHAALTKWFKDSGKTQTIAAESIGMTQGTLNNLLRNKGASLAQMEEVAERLGKDLGDMLIEGRAILAGADSDQTTDQAGPPEFSPEQQAAIEAFKTCLKFGGEGAEVLAKQAIDLAKKKEIEAGFQNTTPKRYSKSA